MSPGGGRPRVQETPVSLLFFNFFFLLIYHLFVCINLVIYNNICLLYYFLGGEGAPKVYKEIIVCKCSALVLTPLLFSEILNPPMLYFQLLPFAKGYN